MPPAVNCCKFSYLFVCMSVHSGANKVPCTPCHVQQCTLLWAEGSGPSCILSSLWQPSASNQESEAACQVGNHYLFTLLTLLGIVWSLQAPRPGCWPTPALNCFSSIWELITRSQYYLQGEYLQILPSYLTVWKSYMHGIVIELEDNSYLYLELYY